MSDFYDDDYDDEDPINPAPEKKRENAGELTITVNFRDYIGRDLEAVVQHAVVERVSAEMVKILRQKIELLIDTQITEQVTKIADGMVDQYLNKTFRKTNTWGEPTGEEIVLRDMVMDRLEKYLQQKVDAKTGEPARGYRDERAVTRTGYFIEQMAIRDLNDCVKEEVEKISAEARERVKAFVSDFVAQQLAPELKAPSLPGPDKQ